MQNPWALIIAGIVTILNTVVNYLATMKAEQRTEEVIRGRQLQEANDISDAIAAARDGLQHDLDSLQTDPNNRRASNPVQGP
jgi:hypothetical protein